MTALGRYLSLGMASFLLYCGAEITVNEIETSAIRERNRPYKVQKDINSDGRKDFVFEDGSLFLQTSSKKYKRVTRGTFSGQAGYISGDNHFYDLNGQVFDLNAKPKEPRRRDYRNSTSETMLTSMQENKPWA